MSKIKIFALGGLNENGKNMYVVEVNKDIFVFDAGLKYDNDINLGIDYIIPNIDYLIKNRKRIKGIFLTHGHEGNMGATPDVLDRLPEVPVYGTKLTLEMVRKDLDKNQLNKFKLIEIKPHVKIDFGKNSIFPISVTHSIPDAVCYVLYTPDGAIVYTGDFVFDSTMQGSYKTDIGKLAYVGKQGVLCLLCESFYADRKGHTSPNNRVSDFIREVLNGTDDRIIATVMPAHYYRIQEIFNEVSKTHRKIVIMGKKLQNFIRFAHENGYLNYTFDANKTKVIFFTFLSNKNVFITEKINIISNKQSNLLFNVTISLSGDASGSVIRDFHFYNMNFQTRFNTMFQKQYIELHIARYPHTLFFILSISTIYCNSFHIFLYFCQHANKDPARISHPAKSCF